MERYYFKYRFGYINIDEENVYMTDSGNWQETRETEEISRKKSAGRKYIGVYAYVINYSFFLIGWGLVIFSQHTLMTFSVVAALATTYLTISQFVDIDYKKKYRIPLNKITLVKEVKPGRVKIYFANALGIPDSETIERPEEAGYALLQSLAK